MTSPSGHSSSLLRSFRCRPRWSPVLVKWDNAMKAEDIRQKSDDELKDQLLSLKKEAFNLRFQRASGQLENTARVTQVRRDIARVKTIMGERARSAS